MAIFKREKKLEPISDPATTTPSSTTMSPDAVADAEDRIQSLLGQNNSPASTVATPAFDPAPKNDATDTNPSVPPTPIMDDEKEAATSTLELHEEGEENPEITKPSTENDTPASTLDEEEPEETPTPTVDTEENKSTSTIAVTDGDAVAMEDVDREVNELIGKLETEAGKLDGDISNKNEQIKQLQGEIDAATSKKSELDKKIKSLRQVVEASDSAK